MASSKPFAFDAEKLSKFINGDIGIADAIVKAQIKPILDAIPYPKDKEMFAKLSKPNKKAGIHAIEKTIISTMLESQKPFIELAKIALELFGTIEYVIAVLKGGRNPEADPTTFAGAFAANKSKMAEFKTGAPAAESAEPPPPPLPTTIFLGKWQRFSPVGDVSSTGSGPQNGEYTTGGYWPQYQSYAEFRDYETTKLEAIIQTVPEDVKKDIRDGRYGSLGDEWGGMNDHNQIKEKYQTALVSNTNISKYFRPQLINIDGKDIEVDIESDYDVILQKSGPSSHETFYAYAQIKPEAAAQGGGNAQNSAPPSPESFSAEPTSLIKAIKAFLKKTLPVIIKKLLPAILALQQLMSNPPEFIGTIIMTKLKEHFEMFDPALKGTPEGEKYWAGDKFVMDGEAAIEAGLLKITLGIKNGLPTFKSGANPPPPGVKEQPILKQVANLAALPINMLKGVLDAFKNLMKSLFVVPQLPGVMSDFISLNWIKDLLKLPKLLEFLGAKDGDVTKIPFLAIPEAGNLALVPDMIKAFLKMIVAFLNGFIGMPNTILNVELVPKIPEPG